MKQKHFIDSHKGATAVACFALMHHFDQWDNPTAWVYTALHGTYGVLWVMKSALFGDKTWEQRTPLWYGLVIWAALTLYWTAPYIICSRSLEMPMPWLGLCIMTYIIGVFFHFAADMQKHTIRRLLNLNCSKLGLIIVDNGCHGSFVCRCIGLRIRYGTE